MSGVPIPTQNLQLQNATTEELQELHEQITRIWKQVNELSEEQKSHSYLISLEEAGVIPLTENPVAKLVNKIAFYSTAGKFLMKSIHEFFTVVKYSMGLLLAERISIVVTLILNELESLSDGDTTIDYAVNTVWILFFVVLLFTIVTSAIDQGIESKMHDFNILQESKESKILRAVNEAYFQKEVQFYLQQTEHAHDD